MELAASDLDPLLNGATFYGAGGGGARSQGAKLVEGIKKELGDATVSVVAADTMAGDAVVAIPAGFGAPTAMSKQDQLGQVVKAWRNLAERHHRKGFDAVFPGEVGATNTMIPVGVAVREGIPLIDGSGAARAMPALQNSTCADPQFDLPTSPIAMANDERDLIFDAEPAEFADTTMRGIIGAGGFAEAAGIALWAMPATGAAASGIGGTLSNAFEMGRAIAASDPGTDGLMAAIRSVEPKAALLVDGKVTGYDKVVGAGFDHTIVHVEGDGRSAYVTGQNENLLCWIDADAAPAVIAPDLVCYVRPTGEAASNADLTLGDEILVIAIPTPLKGRTDYVIQSYLDLYKTIGYCGGYVPFEG